MKKLIIMLFFPIISFSLKFKDVNEKFYTNTYEIYLNQDKLEVGDILLFKPEYDKIQSIFGHIAIIVENNKMLDMPNTSIRFREMPLKLMTYIENRDIIVLRYKHKDSNFEKEFLKNIYENINYKYSLILPRTDNMHISYCSKLVYDLYEKINKTDTTIFPHNTEFLLPEDFLNAGKNFYVVDIKGEK
ncbi:C40 family peptidase [Oceanivirga miroungae]|uniref:Uncharacterized protein n=1 Tax=Oceanivirga miroungae TaxID=1130046 RepID=A0A6I8M6V0_9FUSO|nr:hypothetical protein [Oceanivirga miroungae]VWL85633.1 hypothetical protein OMES3154_00918 [Oceanivirga miroungae]